MDTLQTSTEESARKFHETVRKSTSTLLQALAKTKQSVVAERLSVSESTVSRMKDEAIENAIKLIVASGLKVVPADYRCAKPELIQAAFAFSKAYLEAMQHDSNLVWDD